MTPVRIYQELLQLSHATFELIEHDDAMIATVYHITQPNGTKLILKICPKREHFLRELFFLEYFSGIIPVPAVVAQIPPTQEYDGAVLMDCLPGAPLVVEEVTQNLSYQMGVMLGRIHLHVTPGYGDMINTGDYSADPASYFALKFEQDFFELCPYISKSFAERCWAYYKEHLELLQEVDGPRITHYDFRPGNIMVQNGTLQGIIDWSAARAAFAQADFCSMEHGQWSEGACHKEAFLSGYSAVRPIPDIHTTMPLLRLARALAVVHYFVTNRKDGSNNQWYIFNRKFLEDFF